MRIEIHYYFDREMVSQFGRTATHEHLLAALGELERSASISKFEVLEQKCAFPTDSDRTKLLDILRDFAMRHHVRLARSFGSRKYGFTLFPPQFLLVHESGELREVFPCEIEGNLIEPNDFLEHLAKGEAWTPQRRRTDAGHGRHREIVSALVANPAKLEPGLTLVGSEVAVSADFAERGSIDLVFKDRRGSYLLVEVKVRANEIDKAIGQVMRHRALFASQNFLDPTVVRVAVACPDVPGQSRRVCEATGITCFVLSQDS